MSQDIFTRPERRNYRRVHVDVEVDLLLNGQNVKTTAVNLSCGGMYLPVKKKEVREQEKVQAAVYLPDMSKPVVVAGEVARVEKGSFLSPRKGGLAIRFSGLYDDNILAIDRFIKDKLH
ncbi:MAG: PilZ domain-containing protein [Deltaproteobacteria bacterium]|nr:PilZ domain-containing protein [Deltaproteobacteria bacterium]